MADDIVKADAELRLVLPLHTLRAGQVVGMAELDRGLEVPAGQAARGRAQGVAPTARRSQMASRTRAPSSIRAVRTARLWAAS